MKEQFTAAILDEAVLIALLAIAAIILAWVGAPKALVIGVVVLIGVFTAILVKAALAQLKKPLIGLEALVGKKARVVEEPHVKGDYYIVMLDGELWRALCKGVCRRGEEVQVVASEGLVLIVKPLAEAKD